MKKTLITIAVIVCLIGSPTLRAAPLKVEKIQGGQAFSINIPAGKALVVVNFVKNTTDRVGLLVAPASINPGVEVLTAAYVNSGANIDEGASDKRITIPGPATAGVSIFLNGYALITYKLISNL